VPPTVTLVVKYAGQRTKSSLQPRAGPIFCLTPRYCRKIALALIDRGGDYWALKRTKPPAAVATGDKDRTPYFALSLGNLAWLVRLVLVGARFTGKGKIWGATPLQTFLLSPPAEEGDEYAKNDYQHGKRNQEP
jgi:hypothetical protein